jgi:hypothetical protein
VATSGQLWTAAIVTLPYCPAFLCRGNRGKLDSPAVDEGFPLFAKSADRGFQRVDSWI